MSCQTPLLTSSSPALSLPPHCRQPPTSLPPLPLPAQSPPQRQMQLPQALRLLLPPLQLLALPQQKSPPTPLSASMQLCGCSQGRPFKSL